MTDTDVSGRLPAQPSTTDLNLWLVRRLKGEGSELTFGQIASIAKDLSAALSKAAATSAPTPAPVSGEREELAKWCDDRKANCRAHGDVFGFGVYEKIATALRTPHGLPGEDEIAKIICWYRYEDDELDVAPTEDDRRIAREILSRLTASREDVK